jgi:hypothetical protein
MSKRCISWMTLIEVLLAIMIFGTGIVSIFSALSWWVSALYDADKRTTAILLAKEGIDILMFQKKRSLALGLPRNCSNIQLYNDWYECRETLLAWSDVATYTIQYDDTQWYYLQAWEYELLEYGLSDQTWLFQQSQNKNPLYKRRIIISPVPGMEQQRDVLLQVRSEVVYGFWERQKMIYLDSYLWKTE